MDHASVFQRERPTQKLVRAAISSLCCVGAATLVGCGAELTDEEETEIEIQSARYPSAAAVLKYEQRAGLRCGAAPVREPTSRLSREVQPLTLMLAIAMAESNLDAQAVGANGASVGCPSGSSDRGLWQINDCYHPEVSTSCATDPACAAREVLRISDGGYTWNQWATYNYGSGHGFLRFLDSAEQAYDRFCTPSAPRSTCASLRCPVGGSLGDVNCDGRADSIDAALIQQYVAGKTRGSGYCQRGLVNLQRADINADGRVDALDAQRILTCSSCTR